MKMEVREIITGWLKDHGYEGLYSPGGECACLVDDLMPCSEYLSDCTAGNKFPCPGPATCPAEGKCSFHVGDRPGEDVKKTKAADSDPIITIFEKYKHLDQLLCDREFMLAGEKKLPNAILCDLWQAIKSSIEKSRS